MLKRVILLLLILAIPTLCADLQLERQQNPDQWVHGILKVEDLTIATIENPNTLIPLGKHKIIISYSPRFKKRTPEIIIENREGIRIHGVGKKNFALAGCVGVSYADYAKLMKKLNKRNTITITAVNLPPHSKLTYLQILLDKLHALKVYLYRYAKMLHLSN